MKAGDLLVIDNAGAYGHTMASNYNEREKAREFLV
jgi:diaminopimelate decarboxylase